MSLSSSLRAGITLVVISMFAIGCNQGDERLAEKARIEGKETAKAELQSQLDNMGLLLQKAKAEGKAQAEAEISASNSNLETKSSRMEEDLKSRHLFYQALKGSYEGKLSAESGQFKIRITLVPSLPPYSGKRSRQLEEITADLNALSFHAQILQWNPENKLSAVGCRVENIRPDLNKGEISIASSECPNLYRLTIVDTETARSRKTVEVAAATAEAIREGRVTELNEIRGEVHPTTNAAIYTLAVKRLSSRN